MKLGKGINYSRYCWQWRGTASKDLNDYMDGTNPSGTNLINSAALLDARNHIALIKQLGFDTVRLPITFHCWSRFNTDTIDANHPYWAVLDNMVDACLANNLNLVICYHHAPTLNINRVKTQWLQIANRPKVLTASNKVLFEIFNEPTDALTNIDFRSHAVEVINLIRNIPNHLNRWMVVGGNWWNDIGFGENGLTGLIPLGLPNIIYTFHTYEPKVFTNQGFKVEHCFKTTGISFPFKEPMPARLIVPECVTFPNGFNEGDWKYRNYTSDQGNGTGFGMGTVEFIKARFKSVKDWSIANGNLPVWCGEWGFHRQLSAVPSDGSIERFARTLIDAFKVEGIDWCWWDFEGPFTIFNPVPDIENLDDAFGVTPILHSKLDPSLNTIFNLQKRVKTTQEFIERNTGTLRPRVVLRLKIEVSTDTSNLKHLELTRTFRALGGNPARTTLEIIPIRSVTFKSFSPLMFSTLSLKVKHFDGSSVDIL